MLGSRFPTGLCMLTALLTQSFTTFSVVSVQCFVSSFSSMVEHPEQMLRNSSEERYRSQCLLWELLQLLTGLVSDFFFLKVNTWHEAFQRVLCNIFSENLENSENFEYHTFLLSNQQLKSMRYLYLFCIAMLFFVKMHGIIETGLKPTHFQIFVYLSSLKNSHSPKKKKQDFSQIRNTHIHN